MIGLQKDNGRSYLYYEVSWSMVSYNLAKFKQNFEIDDTPSNIQSLALSPLGILYVASGSAITAYMCDTIWTDWKFLLSVIQNGINFLLLICILCMSCACKVIYAHRLRCV